MKASASRVVRCIAVLCVAACADPVDPNIGVGDRMTADQAEDVRVGLGHILNLVFSDVRVRANGIGYLRDSPFSFSHFQKFDCGGDWSSSYLQTVQFQFEASATVVYTEAGIVSDISATATMTPYECTVRGIRLTGAPDMQVRIDYSQNADTVRQTVHYAGRVIWESNGRRAACDVDVATSGVSYGSGWEIIEDNAEVCGHALDRR